MACFLKSTSKTLKVLRADNQACKTFKVLRVKKHARPLYLKIEVYVVD